jgi:hypothetical protein
MKERYRMLQLVPILVGMLLLFSGRASGQVCYFERLWDPGTSAQDPAIGLDVLATSDGFTFLVAAKPATYPAQGVVLVHTDPCGTLLWSRYYAASFTPPFGRLERAAGGGYLVYAHVADTAVSSDALFLETDSLGNVLWSNLCGGPALERSGKAISTSDGGHLLYISAAEPTYQPDGYPLLLLKTDSTGQTQWSYEYYDQLATQPSWQDVIECPAGAGGGFLAVESKMILRVGPGGTLLWSRRFSGLDLKRVFSVTNGYMIAATSAVGPSLVKIDPNGVLVWHKTFPTTSTFVDVVVHDAIKTSDGGFALAGEARDQFNAAYPRHGVLLKTDSAGALHFFKAYHPSSTCMFSGIDQDDAGGFVLAGYAVNSPFPDTLAFFAHTDAGGNVYCSEVNIGMPPTMYVLAAQNFPLLRTPQGHNDPFLINPSPFVSPDTIHCMFIVGTEETPAAAGPQVFPNPSGGTFTIERAGTNEEAAAIFLLDVRGRIVREEKFVFAKDEMRRTFYFDVPAGMYLLRMVSEEGVGVVRVIVE